jgi:hypothetical protein
MPVRQRIAQIPPDRCHDHLARILAAFERTLSIPLFRLRNGIVLWSSRHRVTRSQLISPGFDPSGREMR